MHHDICYSNVRAECANSPNQRECMRRGLNRCDYDLSDCLGECGLSPNVISEVHRILALPVFYTIQPGARNAIDYNRDHGTNWFWQQRF